MNAPNYPAVERFDRMPPWDERAELCCLASMLIGDEATRAGIRATIGHADYLSADCQIVHQTACEMLDAGKKMDAVTLRGELDRKGLLSEIGDVGFLAKVLDSVPWHGHGAQYAEIVREKSVLRKLAAAGAKMVREAYEPDGVTADELAQRSVDVVSAIMTSGRAADYWTIADIVQDAYNDLDRKENPLITTGFVTLDNEVGGLGPGEQLLIGARPSMGKSTLLRQMAVRIAREGIPVGFISLEENTKKIARNVLSAEARIENNRIRKRHLTQAEHAQLADSVRYLSTLPIVGSHNKARRLSDIRALVYLWKARHGVKVIMLDYLQRVGGGSGATRYEQTSDVALKLSDLWKETEVAAVVAAQLNRKVEGREDKRPNMADLRDSGQIEQDADGIIFLHREDYYHLSDEAYTPTCKAELIVAKWRDAERGGVVTLGSNMEYQTFLDPNTESGEYLQLVPNPDPFA